MAARKLCAKNGLIAENATTVRQFQSPPWIHACRKISTEESRENEGSIWLAATARFPCARFCDQRSVNSKPPREDSPCPLRLALCHLPFRIHRKMFVLEMLRDPPGCRLYGVRAHRGDAF